jgi:hypothetical protein
VSVVIESGGHEVLASGVFFTYDSNESKITLEYKNDRLACKLIFETDTTSTDPRVNYKSEIPSIPATLAITFINFNHSIGVGLTKPVLIGTIADRELLMHFWVKQLGDTNRKEVGYTFYLGGVIIG